MEKLYFIRGRRGVCTNHVDKRGERGVAEMSTLLNNGCLVKVSTWFVHGFLSIVY